MKTHLLKYCNPELNNYPECAFALNGKGILSKDQMQKLADRRCRQFDAGYCVYKVSIRKPKLP
jgi:hypothetical protein